MKRLATIALFLLAFSGPIWAEPRYQFGTDVSAETVRNIQSGITAGNQFFERYLGIRFNVGFDIVASGNESFVRRHTPSRFYNSGCNGGYANWRHLVICTDSEAFNRGQFAGGLRVQQEVIALHEYVHVLQSELAGGSLDGPAWLVEGFAEYVVLLHKVDQRITNKRNELRHQRGLARQQGDSLMTLEDRRAFNRSPTSVSAGMIAVDSLVSDAGLTSFRDYWMLQGQGRRWQQAFEQAFGLSVEQFYAEFQL